MLRLALKSLLSNKIRFALTSGTVMVGVAFVVAAFVTADSLRSTFGDLAVDINQGIDFRVRGELAFGEITDAIAPPVPEELAAEIRAVDGVAAADGGLFVDGVIPVDGSGRAISTVGPPNAGATWSEDEALSGLYLIDGTWPRGGEQFALDIDAFSDNDFKLANDYLVITPTGPRTFTLTGVVQFGFPENAGLGAVFSVFETPTAQEVLGYPGEFTSIEIRAIPGADLDEMQSRIASILPAGTELITADESTEEFSDAFETFIGPLQTILLVFAFVVLFVSTFIISNTFNIVLGQRVRELSMLRAIGATPGQIRRSVLFESLLMGAAAVLVGLGLGMLGAIGMRQLFAAFGAGLPDGPLPLAARTVIAAVVVGIGFTVVASLLPAIKASRISPVAGLREETFGSADASGRGGLRLLAGGTLLALGLALTALGLFADFEDTATQLWLLGIGAGVVFLAVAVLSPLIARVAVAALARPLGRIFGTAGRLARENAARNPRRTAATAVALTVGLALVVMVSVMGQSLKDTFSKQLSSALEADFLVSTEQVAGLPRTLAQDLRATGVGTVVAFDSDRAQLSFELPETGEQVIEATVTVTDLTAIEQVANLDVSRGSTQQGEVASSLLIHADKAEELGLDVGSQLEMTFVSGETRPVSIAGLYERTAFWGEYLIDETLYSQVATTSLDERVLISVTANLAPEQARATMDAALKSYPQADLEDRQEFQASLESDLNTVLALVNVLLGFALLIALVGIVNTLTLSVFERTREIGLLRAVGMTRRQLRRMIRWEAATVALYGALLGVVLGVGFGVAIAAAVPDEVISGVSVPIIQVVIFVAVATLFGLIAALFPSYRAGRMNILQAIAWQ